MIYNHIKDSYYHLDRFLGTGGSSSVFLATELRSNWMVAIKIPRKDKHLSKMKESDFLQNEYKKMKIFESHPNILNCIWTHTNGFIEINGELSEISYNVIEYSSNGTLRNVIKRTGPLSEDLVKFYFIQIWHAVAYIHSFGIAHMDIKLDNILLDEFFNVKLADFGVSVDVSATGGFADWFWGTAGYMAPEVAHWFPTETYDAYKADVFSLGMWLYFMMFGEFPIEDNHDTWSENDSETIGWVTSLKCSFEAKKLWNRTTSEFQELIGNMLNKNLLMNPSTK